MYFVCLLVESASYLMRMVADGRSLSGTVFSSSIRQSPSAFPASSTRAQLDTVCSCTAFHPKIIGGISFVADTFQISEASCLETIPVPLLLRLHNLFRKILPIIITLHYINIIK
jgi:hypothetical protein